MDAAPQHPARRERMSPYPYIFQTSCKMFLFGTPRSCQYCDHLSDVLFSSSSPSLSSATCTSLTLNGWHPFEFYCVVNKRIGNSLAQFETERACSICWRATMDSYHGQFWLPFAPLEAFPCLGELSLGQPKLQRLGSPGRAGTSRA